MTLLLGVGGGGQPFAAPGVGVPCKYVDVLRAPPVPFGHRPSDCVWVSLTCGCAAFSRTSRPSSFGSSVPYTTASRRLAVVTAVPFGKSVALAAYSATASGPFCRRPAPPGSKIRLTLGTAGFPSTKYPLAFVLNPSRSNAAYDTSPLPL